MDTSGARSELIEAGQSDELRAALTAVVENSTVRGELKYSTQVSRELTRIIACRTYAPPIYELCHLVNIADASGDGANGYERFFFGGHAARAQTFRGYLESSLEKGGWRRPGFERTSEGVAIRYSDGFFNVTFSRMPLLAALMEFIIGTVGYIDLDLCFTKTFSPSGTLKQIGLAANEISTRLYAYLKENLSSVQSQSKFELMLRFLTDHSDDGTLEIDDEAILEFWRMHASDKVGTEFRQFLTALKSFIALDRALEAAHSQRTIINARSIGMDRDAGEIHPDTISIALESVDESGSPFDVLDAEPASQIKFVNKREKRLVQPLIEYGTQARSFPVSVLRAETFGFTQSRITQSLRNKNADDIALQINCEDTTRYQSLLEDYRGHSAQLERVIKAVLYALTQQEKSQDAGATISSIGIKPSEQFDAETRDAFRSLGRKGFEESQIEEHVEGFRAGSEAVLAIKTQVDNFLEVLASKGDMGDQFERDRSVFQAQFETLYGTRA